jgi:phage FluMu gp28-like protein
MKKMQFTSYVAQADIVSIIAQMCFAKRLAFDATGLGGVIKSMLQDKKIKNIIHPVVFNRDWKIQSYQKLRNMMYQGFIKAPEIESMIDEFNALHHDLRTNKIAAPKKSHDDIPSAFIIALDAIKKNRVYANFGTIPTRPVQSNKFSTTTQMLDAYMGSQKKVII